MAANDFTVKKISPKLGGERGARNPNGPTSSHDLVEQMEFLYVQVVEVRNNNPIRFPVVEITLGNYKASTRTLPMGPDMNWNQVFAFDKSKGDILYVQINGKNIIGKRIFKLATDIPTRVPPNQSLAPIWYSMQDTKTGHHMDLKMSIWFGIQVDEVHSKAWFSDASEVQPSCVINTRASTYDAPRLCYVRATIVSAHDLIPNDRNRTPSVYVILKLGKFTLKSNIVSGLNPSWNQDLMFVTSESFEDTLYIELWEYNQIDGQHDRCIGTLQKKVSEMTPLKAPSSAPVITYDIEPLGKMEPAGDTRRFASTIKMKLATDQAYHVFDECTHYTSDYRAFAKGLWPGVLGKLEVGILSATGLKNRDENKPSPDSYVVAKYGNKWARTRTVLNSSSPKWNEQYSWNIYEKCTVFTLGVYDNRELYDNYYVFNDKIPLGKVRILLGSLEWNRIYTYSYPITYLDVSGLKKMGEIQLAIRCVSVTEPYALLRSPFSCLLPKAHYKYPLSVYQIEALRLQAVELHCINLSKTEPRLRYEVVMDMLETKNRNFSMRSLKANIERVQRVTRILFVNPYRWIDAKIVSTTSLEPKLVTCGIYVIFICFMDQILWLALCLVVVLTCIRDKFMSGKYSPPSILLDAMNPSELGSPNYFDELEEEFDTYPSSVDDINVLRMRYDRLRSWLAIRTPFLGDVASQGERLITLLTFNGLCAVCFLAVMYLFFSYSYWGRGLVGLACVIYLVNFPMWRNDLPSVLKNWFRRLPTK